MKKIELVIAGRPYLSQDVTPVKSLKGDVIGEICQAPQLLVHHAFAETLKSQELCRHSVLAVIERAGSIYLNDTLDGLDPSEYCKTVNSLTGLPISSVENSLKDVGSFLKNINRILEAQVSQDQCIKNAKTGCYSIAKDRPYGKIFCTVLPGNHPSVNTAWLNALALGYKVIIKPAKNDPVTPLRLISALNKASLQEGVISYIPGDHATAKELVNVSRNHRLMFYGGSDIEKEYGNLRHVIVRGPGYSKVFIDGKYMKDEGEKAAEFIASSISLDGGVKCTNASGIVLKDASADELVSLVNVKLSQKVAAPIGDPKAELLTFSLERAQNILKSIRQNIRRTTGSSPDLGDLICDFGDGSAALKPQLFDIEGSGIPTGFEYSGAFAWVRSFESPEDLKDTLSLSVLSNDRRNFDVFSQETSIRKILFNLPTTYSDPFLPHDGTLYSRLFERIGIAAPENIAG